MKYEDIMRNPGILEYYPLRFSCVWEIDGYAKA